MEKLPLTRLFKNSHQRRINGVIMAAHEKESMKYVKTLEDESLDAWVYFHESL